MIEAALLVVLGISSLGFLIILIADGVASAAVPGSIRRYQAVTVIVTLFAPMVVASAVYAVAMLLAGDYISVAFTLLRIFLSYRDWKRHKDEDNWWKGRGKKMLDGIDRAISRLSPATARAGA